MHRLSRFTFALIASLLLIALASPSASGQQGHSPFPAATPDASSTPAAGTTWEITDIQLLDLEGQPIALSPDGQWLAGINPDNQLCVWDVTSLKPTCDEESLPIYPDSITWAPDGSAVAFSLDAFVRAYESDIYVFDPATGASENVTEDGVEGGILRIDSPDGKPVPIDVLPAWSADSQSLTFVRTEWDGENPATELMTIARAGGDPERRHTVSDDVPLAIYTPMFSLEDGSLLYAVSLPGFDDPATGLWRLDANGEARRILSGTVSEAFPVPAITDVVERDGKVKISGFSTFAFNQLGWESAIAFTFDPGSGEVTPLEFRNEDEMKPAIPALSPDGGSTLAVLPGAESDEVVMTGAASQVVTLGPRIDGSAINTARFRAPDWAENNTVLVPAVLSSMPYLVTVVPGSSEATPVAPCSCTQPPEQG